LQLAEHRFSAHLAPALPCPLHVERARPRDGEDPRAQATALAVVTAGAELLDEAREGRLRHLLRLGVGETEPSRERRNGGPIANEGRRLKRVPTRDSSSPTERTNRSAKALQFGARGGPRIGVTPADRSTSRNAPPNFPSRSRRSSDLGNPSTEPDCYHRRRRHDPATQQRRSREVLSSRRCPGAPTMTPLEIGERIVAQGRWLRLLLMHLAGPQVLAKVELEDLSQEVYVRAIAHADQLPPEEPADLPLRRFLARLARSVVVDAVRAIRARAVERRARSSGCRTRLEPDRTPGGASSPAPGRALRPRRRSGRSRRGCSPPSTSSRRSTGACWGCASSRAFRPPRRRAAWGAAKTP
jgi:hypothetical protein